MFGDKAWDIGEIRKEGLNAFPPEEHSQDSGCRQPSDNNPPAITRFAVVLWCTTLCAKAFLMMKSYSSGPIRDYLSRDITRLEGRIRERK